MALTNFILTVAAVGVGMLLFTTDIRKSAAHFRRNARQIKHWLEEDAGAAASKSANEGTLKKLDSTVPKEKPKEDNH